MPSLVEIYLAVQDENVKVYDNDSDDNDDGQWTNYDQKSSLERSAQVS